MSFVMEEKFPLGVSIPCLWSCIIGFLLQAHGCDMSWVWKKKFLSRSLFLASRHVFLASCCKFLVVIYCGRECLSRGVCFTAPVCLGIHYRFCQSSVVGMVSWLDQDIAAQNRLFN
ncbi:uncharacterized protein LOC108986260 [Juglans regia]|uniref:Uncharacterized protein LOC108986260 n=1 Tax=Juglans regia TaxID=51240 RepID=A0A2I4E4Q1_JUGRE|nr:uncharacterized protein LOC108986260 [Juglans regia]XP_018814370.1 uncharacterized protein LOC108986260 [Juglans regia]